MNGWAGLVLGLAVGFPAGVAFRDSWTMLRSALRSRAAKETSSE